MAIIAYPLGTKGGVGGGGKLTIGVDDNTEENVLSTSVTKIIWATDALGFSATLHPDDPDGKTVVIGDPPQFEPPLSWSPVANTQVRVSEPDPAEPDVFDDAGWANSNQKGTNTSTPSWQSTLGRGLGDDSSMTIVVQLSGVIVETMTLVANGNGTTTQGGVTVSITSYAADGDGSAFEGRIRVTLDTNHYTGGADISGQFQIGWAYTEHKWGDVINFSEKFFYDKDPSTPVISGAPSIIEHATPSERVTKFISGIQYYTLGSKFTVEVPDIDEHNQDTSKPSDSLRVTSQMFGINNYTSSPWVQTSVWSDVGNLDTSAAFDYLEDREVDMTNYRHIGDADVKNYVSDSWSESGAVNSNTLRVAIDTWSDDSTDSLETFNGESKRLEPDYTTAHDSERYLVDGEAVVYNGALFHGADLPNVFESVEQALGSLGSMTTLLPNQKPDGVARGNPNYSVHTRKAVFFRKFPSGATGTKASFLMNIATNGDLETYLKSGKLKIYLWKENSVNTGSPNVGYPPNYDPADPNASTVGSIWLHGNNNYNFGTFTDGETQDNSNATCRSQVVGTTVQGTFGGNDLIGDLLVRFELDVGVSIQEVSITFQ